MSSLPPWSNGPFELMVHAESHFRKADDFDRRIALISFDNAIEVAITTYLTLHPIQRGNREYSRDNVDKWKKDYHTKLEFLEREIENRNLEWVVDRAHIIWAHENRNEQYHSGQKGIPEIRVLQIARAAALWVFSVLFDVDDVETALDKAVLDQAPPAPPSQERELDVAIDEEYGIITVGEQDYYASELLFATDYTAYRDLGGKLTEDSVTMADDEVQS